MSSKFSRLMKISGLATKVSTSYLSSKVKENFLSEERVAQYKMSKSLLNAGRIAQTLGEMKGLAMKLGQMLSIQADLLPPEVLKILGTLQQQAPAVPFEAISAQLKRELGDDFFDHFQSFDKESFRSASIGQVHRAVTLAGDEVVVKVQYPDVDEVIRHDIENFKLLTKTIDAVGLKSLNIDGVFEEVKERISEELDYKLEAEHIAAFRAFFKDDPRIVIPRVYPELSSQRVLTLSYEYGDSQEDVVANYPQETRDLIGQNLLHLFAQQCVVFGMVHTDPHPGNFSFRSDGRIVFYDFGCVKSLDAYWRGLIKRFLVALIKEDYVELEELFVTMGSYNDPTKRYGQELFEPYVKAIRRVFSLKKDYDFGSMNLTKYFMTLGKRHLRYAFEFRALPETLFLNRMIAGHYTTLRALGSRGPFGQILASYLDL